MQIIFELSKEHKTLPKAEVIACLHADEINFSIVESTDDALVIETEVNEKKIKQLANRLSSVFFVDELLFSCTSSISEIKKQAVLNNINKKGSIAISYKNRTKTIDSQPIVKALAGIYTKGKTVDLKKPDIHVRVLITESSIFVGLQIVETDRKQFETRKVQYRPFFSPISLHPKLARSLVNLSMVKKNETLLDPFCGTGGMLLEAGFLDIKIIGSDIEEKMIEGCRKTLDFYKIKNFDLYCCDIGKIKNHIKEVDAIVTDLPYGKSTTTKGEDLVQLYDRTFQNISDLLKEGKRAVVGLSNKEMISIGKKYFSLVESHEFKVHRSLTRYFAIFQK